MIVKALCEIFKNVKIDNYTAVEGQNTLYLEDDEGNEIAVHTAPVLWCGSGSPFPTPPGGPWKTDYMPNHPRLGRCFFVRSDKETEIFIHFAQKKSYGCLIVNTNRGGTDFFEKLITNRDGLKVVQLMPIDSRSDDEKIANPIDYTKITKMIS